MAKILSFKRSSHKDEQSSMWETMKDEFVSLPKLTKVALFSLLLLGVATPLIASKQLFEIRQRAASSTVPQVVFVDSNNNALTQITSPQVSVRLTSPWPATGTAEGSDVQEVAGQSTAVFQVASSYDDVNEDGTLFDALSKTVFLGNGQSKTASYTGLRFTNVSIPQGATILSARLQVYSPQNSWITVKTSYAFENTGNSSAFSSSSKPSSRSRSTAVTYNSNTKWKANTWYTLNELATALQPIVNRSDWRSGNSLALIVKGTGGSWGRKFVSSVDGGISQAPKLVVTYSSSGTTTPSNTPAPTTAATATPVPPTATRVPTATTVPATATPTVTVTTKSVTLAEDANFSQHVVTIPYTTNPLITSYTFSNATPGVKNLYAKFLASNGTEQVFMSSIDLVTASTPTPAISTMPTGMNTGDNSHAMGLWNPNPKYDTCPSYPASADTNGNGTVEDSEKIAYIKMIHDNYKVKGPDGKWYPTWHPPVDPTTGCKFGHEHGQDPSTVAIWDEVKDHYAYVNPDGTKDLAHAGIPFGYVNQQMDAWEAANGGTMAMRHEDHVGHKIAIAKDFTIKLNRGDGTPSFDYPGVTCNYIVKVHQGTHSKDAFENNLHEVLYNVHCSDGHRINLDTMGIFGSPGQFTRQCDPQGDRSTIIKTGFDYASSTYPSSNGGTRGIIDRNCVEAGFLVPSGQFSANAYEPWPVSLNLTKTNGAALVDYLNLLFDVEDSVRYYYPGHVDSTTGLVDNLGHFQDLCYENLNGRTMRGGGCDLSTQYGSIKGITWDDPRAAFKDLSRGTYFKPGATSNTAGPNVWYSDPFGRNAQTSPFPGSLKQYISNDAINYGQKAGAFESANVINMTHDDGHGTVHAPN